MLILIIIVLGVLLFGVLYSNFEIRFNFTRHTEASSISIGLVGPYGIFEHTRKIPITNLTGKDKNTPVSNANTESVNQEHKSADDDNPIYSMHSIREILDNYKKFYAIYEPYINKIKRKSISNSIYWHTKIGTNDAAETAIMVGIVWIIKGSIMSFMAREYNFSDVFIDVIPNYNTNIFETTVDCIFNIKLGHIVNANISILLAHIRGGVKK